MAMVGRLISARNLDIWKPGFFPGVLPTRLWCRALGEAMGYRMAHVSLYLVACSTDGTGTGTGRQNNAAGWPCAQVCVAYRVVADPAVPSGCRVQCLSRPQTTPSIIVVPPHILKQVWPVGLAFACPECGFHHLVHLFLMLPLMLSSFSVSSLPFVVKRNWKCKPLQAFARGLR